MSKHITHITYKATGKRSSVTLTMLLLLLSLCCVNQPVKANALEAVIDADSTPTIAELEKQQLLQLYSYKLWQRINEVRSNPIEQLSALGINIDQAALALGATDEWLLDTGLPPLAWNDQLANAAQLHGQDMVDHLYYDQINLEGQDPQQRIEAQGYAVQQADETLALLAFPNYMAMDQAVEILLQNMLRDELTVGTGVARNIFSTTYSTVGIAFKAEILEQLVGQNYVYLLVVDVAEPLEAQQWLVGVAALQTQIAFRDYFTGFWSALAIMPGGGFQQPLGEAGGELYAFDADGVLLQSQPVYPNYDAKHYINWSNL